MSKKREKMSGKTVRKMYRLARELEAANNVTVIWKTDFFEGRRVFYFDLIPKKEIHRDLFGVSGYGFSVQGALRNFYRDIGNLLMSEKLFTPEERKMYKCPVKDDYLPGRYPCDSSIYAAPGHHGKQVVLA